MALRFDTQTLNPNQLRPPWTNGDGSTVFDAYLAAERVLTYKRPDGSTRTEFRPAEENFKARALFGLIPATDEHPPGLLKHLKDNDRYKKGITLSEPEFIAKGGYVRCAIAVLDSKLAEEIKAGEKNQLSTGYKCDTEETPGVWLDQYGVMGMPGASYSYDAIQRNIQPDHQAFTKKGRAGTDIAAFVGRLDSAADGLDVAWAECPTCPPICPPIYQEHFSRPTTDSDCNCKEKGMTNQFVEERADGRGKKKMMKTITLDMGDGTQESYQFEEDDQQVMDMFNAMKKSSQRKMDELAADYEEKMDSLRNDLEEALEMAQEYETQLQTRTDSNDDDDDEYEYVLEGNIQVPEEWAIPLLEIQENLDSVVSDEYPDGMTIPDLLQHNASEHESLQTNYDSLVMDRLDSSNIEFSDLDKETQDRLMLEGMKQRMDGYAKVKDLLDHSTYFDPTVAAEDWALKALEQNGIHADSANIDIDTAITILKANGGRFIKEQEVTLDAADEQRARLEAMMGYGNDPIRNDSYVDPAIAQKKAWQDMVNDWKD